MRQAARPKDETDHAEHNGPVETHIITRSPDETAVLRIPPQPLCRRRAWTCA
jgi:hypothetical protein